MKEFAANGYENASTNQIIKEAGISKGLLFHYFTSKKNLYLYVLDQCMDEYMQYIHQHLEELPADLLERLLKITAIKVKMFLETPSMYSIVASLVMNTPAELKEDIEQRLNKLKQDNYPLLLGGVDVTKFRPGVDQQRAIELVLASMEGLSTKYQQLYKDQPDKGLEQLQQITTELEQYVEMLRHGLYPPPQKEG